MKKMLAVSAILLLLIGLTVAVAWASDIYTEIMADGACAFSETLTTPFAQFNQSAAVSGPASYLYVDQWAWTDWCWGQGIQVEHYVEAEGCWVEYHQDIGLQVEDAFLMTAGLDVSGQYGYFRLEGLYPPFSTTEAGYDDYYEEGWLGMRGELWAEFEAGNITLAHYLEANCCPIHLKYVLDEDPRSFPPIVNQSGWVDPGDSYAFLFTIFLVNQGIDLGFLIDDDAWCAWGP